MACCFPGGLFSPCSQETRAGPASAAPKSVGLGHFWSVLTVLGPCPPQPRFSLELPMTWALLLLAIPSLPSPLPSLPTHQLCSAAQPLLKLLPFGVGICWLWNSLFVFSLGFGGIEPLPFPAIRRKSLGKMSRDVDLTWPFGGECTERRLQGCGELFALPQNVCSLGQVGKQHTNLIPPGLYPKRDS